MAADDDARAGDGVAPPADFGRKYRALDPALLARVWREACTIERRPADALKRAKRALHQLHSAFVEERELAAVEAKFAAWQEQRAISTASGTAGDQEAPPADLALQPIAREVLSAHASTRERLPSLAALREELHARLGTPASLLDLGCGLMPFALPWLGWPRAMAYHAREVDGRMAALVGRWFAAIGQAGSAATIDLVGASETLPAAEIALLFKLLPTLERQRAGAAGELLDRLAARGVRAAVLSFPTRSLGAKSKGMREQYGKFAAELLLPRHWSSEPFEQGDEWFVIARPP